MNAFQLNKVEKMLLALLRASLHQKEVELSFFHNVSISEWEECYQLAVNQGVMALAWDGVLQLPRELQPSKAVKLNWAFSVEAYEKKYQQYCRTAETLTAFYAKHGIATLVLKGVGFSTLYPVPSHREGGDIDIFTYAAQGSALTDTEANARANQLIREKGIKVEDFHSYMHTTFYYKGIPIENHHHLLDIHRYNAAKQVSGLLEDMLNPQLVSLAEGQIWIPDSRFNTLYLAFHTFHHLGHGMKLHHLCDWAIQIGKYGLELPAELKDSAFLEGVNALTRLCNEYLGVDIPVKGGEELADVMLQEMVRPTFDEVVPTNSKSGILWYKFRRLLHRYQLSNRVLRGSQLWYLWFIFTFHLKYPETNFRKRQR